MFAESLLDTLPPVSLEGINERAALQTRIDRKYLVPRSLLGRVALWIPPDSRVLEIDGKRHLDYASVYFDTPDVRSYTEALHRRRKRCKVRTRLYRDTGLAFLEVKTKGPRGETVKQRVPHERAALVALGAQGAAYADSVLCEVDGAHTRVQDLAPTLLSEYRRVTVMLTPDTETASAARVTIDERLVWGLINPETGQRTRSIGLPNHVIIETKSGVRASASDRALWRLGVRPVSISKYCVGLAALRPELPRGRWTRTLARALEHEARAADPQSHENSAPVLAAPLHLGPAPTLTASR